MNRMFIRKTPFKNDAESLSPETREIIHNTSLDKLKKLYEKCSEERVPRNALIDAIEKEIFRRTFNEKTMKIDRIYWLEPKDKKKVPK